MLKYYTISLFLILSLNSSAQNLKIVAGAVDTTTNTYHYFKGITDNDAKIFVAGKEFPVYGTGAFAAETELKEGNNEIEIIAQRGAKQTKEIVKIFRKRRNVITATEGFAIENIEIFPPQDMTVAVNDVIKIKVKASPNCKVTWLNNIQLHELPVSETNGIAGIYQSSYIVKDNDKNFKKPVRVKISNGKKSIKKEVKTKIVFMDKNAEPLMLRTKGELPYLNYGLGTDRLGGSKISHIVEGIILQATGKAGNLYKVQLSKNYQAWIPEDCVETVSPGMFKPQSLTGSWNARSNEKYDIVSISLGDKLPFRTFHEINPSKIIVDIFGATSNTSWITQYPETLKQIKNLTCEQIEDDIFRVIIELAHNHWGHKIEYRGNNLEISVKHQPKLELDSLHIAIDAGHGGSNIGARGTTGSVEKDINLKFAKILQEKLEAKRIKVSLTRNDDTDMSMSERILFLRKTNPDLLVSVHCNAGGSPFTGKGTSTYYRHIGFRPLSTAILKRLLELDVNNFGNVGSFNFALNSPIEYPNVLVETLFISSPEDEAKLLDDNFKNQMVDKIIAGLQDFLDEQKTNTADR
ncbi:MAG: N-acetylmuramoyl-L-alanine amidase [Prevotellaceae bacterium]|jgi:N-acetylmuramoyl-L-alanine amidase|nr:N-acetylmuramoyl-L-alanine amidase [Prevotellaceae bacterium]